MHSQIQLFKLSLNTKIVQAYLQYRAIVKKKHITSQMLTLKTDILKLDKNKAIEITINPLHVNDLF